MVFTKLPLITGDKSGMPLPCYFFMVEFRSNAARDGFLDNEQLDASLFNFCEFCRLTPAIEDHRVVSLKFRVLLGIHMEAAVLLFC